MTSRTPRPSLVSLTIAALAGPLALVGCSAAITETADAAKGDTIEFGAYEQDGDTANGTEAIRWTVLDRIDDRILVLADAVLAARVYDVDSFEDTTWAQSDLRAWLNEDFFADAFTADQQAQIVEAELINADGSVSGVDGGADTVDRVFVLSQTEYGIYLADAESQEFTAPARASDTAAAQGLYIDEDGDTDWWLRSPGTYPYAAQYVQPDGTVFPGGSNVDATLGVRPAIWIDLSA